MTPKSHLKIIQVKIKRSKNCRYIFFINDDKKYIIQYLDMNINYGDTSILGRRNMRIFWSWKDLLNSQVNIKACTSPLKSLLSGSFQILDNTLGDWIIGIRSSSKSNMPIKGKWSGRQASTISQQENQSKLNLPMIKP